MCVPVGKDSGKGKGKDSGKGKGKDGGKGKGKGKGKDGKGKGKGKVRRRPRPPGARSQRAHQLPTPCFAGSCQADCRTSPAQGRVHCPW